MSDEDSTLDLGAALKGAIVGGIASFVESMVVAMPFMSGTPTTQAQAEAMAKALMSNSSYLMTDLGASLFCVAVAGYVAAGSAGRSGTLNGAVAGSFMLLVVGAMAMMSSQQPPGWYSGAVFVLTVPAGALGGMFRGT